MRPRALVARCAAASTVLLLAAACGDGGGDSAEPAPEARATTGTTPSTTPPDATTTTTAATTTTTLPTGPSSGCGSSSAEPGQERVEWSSGGRDWWYLQHVPPAHDGTTPVPLVLAFHGYGEGAEVHVLNSGLPAFAEQHGFVTVFPQGQGEVAHWNADQSGPDVAYVGELLDRLEETLCLDRARVHATGLSNGAFMTSAVGCAHADRIASIAPVAGIRGVMGCGRAVPVATFHGTADTFVTFDGSIGPSVADLPAPDGSGRTLGELEAEDPGVAGTSIPQHAAAWATNNGCEEADPAEEPMAADVVLLRWDCPVGAPVLLYRVDGGGHAWPGSEFSASIEQLVGHTTMSISANEVMWAFFEAHPLR